MNLPCEYSYTPRLRLILFTSGAGVAWIVIESVVCTCRPGRTTVAFGLIPIALGLLLATRRFAFHRSLLLGANELVIPAGFLRLRITRIPYESIDRVWRVTLLGMSVLCVRTASRKFEIPSTMLPDGRSYLEVEKFLRARAQQNEIARKGGDH